MRMMLRPPRADFVVGDANGGGPEAPLGATADVAVEIADPARFCALLESWSDLITRAEVCNACMHPAVAAAAQASGARVTVLLGWRSTGRRAPGRLVGVWVLAAGPLARRWPVPALLSPIDATMMLGTPVLDRDHLVETLAAMLDTLAADQSLPNILRATLFTWEGPMKDALGQVLAAREAPPKLIRRLTRAKLQVGLEPEAYLQRALSRARRHQLRRCRRRLAETGRLELTSHRGPHEVRGAFEEFLALEAAGWKGRAGTALLRSGETTVSFVRGVVMGLAEDGLVEIVMLRRDGRPAAAQVLLYCGRTAFTWKTAYDEALRGCAPGLLVMEDVTRMLLAKPKLEFADISTNREPAEVAAQASFWTEQLVVADMLIDVRRGGSIQLRLLFLAKQARNLYAAAERRVGKLLGRRRVQQIAPAVSIPSGGGAGPKSGDAPANVRH